MLSRIRLFVFDNNGTALDDLHVAYGNTAATFQVLGIPVPTLEQFRNEIRADFMHFYWRHGVPRDVTGDQINVIRKLYYRMRPDAASYRSDFRRILTRCQDSHVRVGMCSAEIPDVLLDFLLRADLLKLFDPDLVRAGAWPSKAPVLASMARDLELEPLVCAYVDDTDDGIAAAREAGFYTIGFAHPTGYNSIERIRAANPDMIVGSFTELDNALPKLLGRLPL